MAVKDRTNFSWGRRFVTLPIWFGGFLLFTSLLATLPLTALIDLIRRNRFTLSRTLIYFATFFSIECAGLVGAFLLWIIHLVRRDQAWYEHQNRRLQRWWASNLFWGCVRTFSMTVDIEGQDKIEDTRPSLILCRHASTLDTMLPIAASRRLKYFRYVIKAELLNDPCMDYVARRFPNVFVERGSDNPEREIEKVIQLGKEMEENDALVIYPEGTRYTPQKRERLLEKFADDPEMLAVTKRLKNTLPPLREGGVSLVETMKDSDVVFVAHRGIDGVGAMSDLITGGLIGTEMEVVTWRYDADAVPREREAVRAFMADNWAVVDRFVRDGNAALEDLPPAAREDIGDSDAPANDAPPMTSSEPVAEERATG